MSDLHWTDYVAVVTGAAGMVTGLISLRRTNKIKALDLRLELAKAVADARRSCETLPDLIAEAGRSRLAILSARGRLRSGAQVTWESAVATDRATLAELAGQLPAAVTDYRDLSPEALETRLVEIHTLTTRLGELRVRYTTALADDDNTRRDLERAHMGPPR